MSRYHPISDQQGTTVTPGYRRSTADVEDKNHRVFIPLKTGTAPGRWGSGRVRERDMLLLLSAS